MDSIFVSVKRVLERECRELNKASNLDEFVAAAADDVDAVIADVDGVDGVGHWTVQLADQRPVVRLPEPDLTVGAGRHDLVLEWVITDVLEQSVDTQHVTTRPLAAINTSTHNTTIIAVVRYRHNA